MESKLLLYLKFENNIADSSDNHINGTLIGGVNYEQGVDGSGKAIVLGGLSSPDRISIPFDPSFQFSNEITISYWLKINNKRGTDGNGNEKTEGFHSIFQGSKVSNLLYTNWGNSTFYYPSNNIRLQAGGILNTHEWVHISYVISANSAVSYVNGVKYSENSEATPIDLSTSSGFSIGRQADNWYPLDGSLDNFRIYNRALNANEVKSLYETKQ
ncbi:LamG domain-containing protein [Bacillus sp. B190/17]|uniref:LamG domain-containing protein n=1 Tax=Bacillus lumedeiriae TaxID=3058829 RepID=A0ABW8I7T5_9BACI